MNHITQAKRALKQALIAQLPAKLLAADTEADDGITTPEPYEVHTTEKADLGGLPSIEIVVTNSTPTGDTWASIYRHRVVIGVTTGGDDEDTISTQVERYLWALRKIAEDSQTAPVQSIGTIDRGEEQYTPLQQRPETVENPFVKGAFVEVFVTTVG